MEQKYAAEIKELETKLNGLELKNELLSTELQGSKRENLEFKAFYSVF